SLEVLAETEARRLPSVPTLGLGTILQAVPFQCSTSVCPRNTLQSLPVQKPPTAQASLGVRASTLRRTLWNEPALGLEMMLQVLPFQCSIKVWRMPATR